MVKLDIISDPICPWCYIGKTLLDKALAERPDHPFEIEWHPFQLNPDMPPEGMDRHVYLEKKFGGQEGAARAYAPIVEAAEAAGLRPLDILVKMDGKQIPVTEGSDLPVFAQQLRDMKAGYTVTFTRKSPEDGSTEDVEATLMRAPKSELLAERRSDDAFEFSVREITLDVKLGQRLPDVQGVVVDAVERAGWAGLAKLPVGVILQRINKHEVTDLATFEAAMAKVKETKPDQVLFFVRYRRSTQFHVAEPDWDEAKDAQ